MNMIGGSVKRDGLIFKILFCAMADLCHTRKGNLAKLTWPTPPSTLLFNAKLYLIIGEYHHMIREARLLALISCLAPLCQTRYATSLVMVILCLLSTKSLDWASRSLHSKNYF